MAITPLSSIMLNDPNYRFALLYNLIDKTVCEFLDQELDEVKLRFQVKIELKKINISFFYLDKYILTYIKTNEQIVKDMILEQITKQRLSPKNIYKVYFKYVS